MNTVTTFLRLVFVTLGLSGLAGPVSAQTAALDCAKFSGDAAIAACDRAIRQDPKKPVHFYNRGLVWSAKGDKDKAISDYNEAIRLNPQHALAFSNRGLAWSAKGFKDKAISDYNEAIRLLRCSATIWTRKQRQSGMPSWRSQFDDDCRDATITLAIFVGRRS